MHFQLVDRVLESEPGERIVAVKAVSLAEEYLQDHFPTFPVLPGVLMLETMIEAARWLMWTTLDFDPSLILLREARNVTYKSFVAPGHLLKVDVTCKEWTPTESDFMGTGSCDEQEVVKARFSLVHWRLARERPELDPIDRRLRERARQRWSVLRGAGTVPGTDV